MIKMTTDELITNREHEARVDKFKIYEPPVMVGDHIFLPRESVKEFEVSYLGWDGKAWDITLTMFENGMPTDKSEKIRATSLDGIYWFKTKEECQRFIEYLDTLNKDD